MKKTLRFIGAVCICISLASCGNDAGSSANKGETVSLSLEEIQVSGKIKIIDCGRGGDNNDAIWVTCKGHSEASKLIVNGTVLTTNYYEKHLTASLPQLYIDSTDLPLRIVVATFEKNDKSFAFELGKDYKRVLNGTSEIEIVSSGLGGDNNSAVWITCKNHSISSSIYVGSTRLVTNYYDDHLTAALPQNLQGRALDSVFIKDDETRLKSVAIKIQ